jgi:hypothetical protein
MEEGGVGCDRPMPKILFGKIFLRFYMELPNLGGYNVTNIMKHLITAATLLILTGCTNCYNHFNSDNHFNGPLGEEKLVIKPVPTPKSAAIKTTSDEWVLTSVTKEKVASYLVLQ